ncbi:class I SAM-dependent methyltransferase [Bacillus fonticola]|uniref:class I SAM-dependent methyltransferase n=1 Tax=Bacillus fonticola TaxID=2728853 RepID=UPI00147327C5|nr:class I SAM-dependent methyltransferase [Bacillus fonticola]
MEDWTQLTKAAWDERANDWAQRSEKMWLTGSRKTIVPFLLNHVERNDHVCDVGCGDGMGSMLLAEEGFTVTGIDISSEMIQLAKDRLNRAGLSRNRNSFEVGSSTSLPFSERAFDGCMAINSIEWVEHPIDVLEEMNRVVKPGGWLCTSILGPTAGPRTNSFNRLMKKKAICNTMMPWEWRQLLEQTGWKIVAQQGIWKEAFSGEKAAQLPVLLQQAVSFSWLLLAKRTKENC